jgi:hypothetical protein
VQMGPGHKVREESVDTPSFRKKVVFYDRSAQKIGSRIGPKDPLAIRLDRLAPGEADRFLAGCITSVTSGGVRGTTCGETTAKMHLRTTRFFLGAVVAKGQTGLVIHEHLTLEKLKTFWKWVESNRTAGSTESPDLTPGRTFCHRNVTYLWGGK